MKQKYFLAAFFIILLSVVPIRSQKTYTTFSDLEAKQILEVIYPLSTTKYDPIKQDFAMDIRINLGSQLSIIKLDKIYFDKNQYEITLHRLSDSKTGYGTQIRKLPDFGKEKDLRKLAKQIKMERTQIKKFKPITKLLKTFFINSGFQTEPNFTLDGVTFEIWYVDKGTTFYFSRIEGENYYKGEPKLVTFARKIVQQAVKTANKQNQKRE